MFISQTEADRFMLENTKFFENTEISRFTQIISESNITVAELNTFRFKSPTLAILLSVLLGWLGIDRFYSGNYIMGVIKLCTFGFSGIWWVIDWFLIRKAIKQKNQIRFYNFLTGTVPTSSINMDTVKNIVRSKEVQNAAKEVIKSRKEVIDTFDINN